MKTVRRLATVSCLVVGSAAVAWSSFPAPVAPVDVEVVLRHTRFEPSVLRVHAGTTVRFVIHNLDPIDHEFLLGDQDAQDAHELGTESHHGAKPGEVSVPARSTASTTYRFTEPGVVLLGCHLPGHWDHGMRGRVIVLD